MRYYDAVLLVIPAVMMAGVIGGIGLPMIGVPQAMAVVGVIASAIVGHAMFIRAPTDLNPPQTASQDSTTDSSSTEIDPAD